MQNNGLIKLFGILFGLVSLYQLSFTFIASNQEKNAKKYASELFFENEENFLIKREAAEKKYLDSLGNASIFGFTTYNRAKEKELNKGLDLKGGINVILQISVKDILKSLANYSKDRTFNEALYKADILQKNKKEPYIESFFTSFENLDENARLSAPSIFGNKNLSDEINFEMTNDQTKFVLRKKINESIISAFEVLRKRIDKFGVTQPNIQRLGSSGRILVELPGAKDIERIKSLLQSTAQLEFWETFKGEDFFSFIIDADTFLRKKIAAEKKSAEEKIQKEQESKNVLQLDNENTLQLDNENNNSENTLQLGGATDNSDSEQSIDELLADVKTATNESDSLNVEVKNNPLLSLVKGRGYQNGPIIAQFSISDREKISEYLDMSDVRKLLPKKFRYVKFAWGIPNTTTGLIDLYVLKSNRNGIPPLGGAVVVDASQSYDQLGNPSISMQMNLKGSRIWENLTRKAYTDRSNIAIVLDETVYSAPGVSNGAIAGGRSEITGQFTLNGAIDLANVLRAGKLPASAEIIQSEIVGPSLGKEAIENGIYSFIIALLFVLIWMVLYYGRAGFFADIALLFNILLIFGVLTGLGAVLTLPGIAGIVLTIGISVDANVLIFERVREELKKGKGLAKSISDGFNNALSSNIRC